MRRSRLIRSLVAWLGAAALAAAATAAPLPELATNEQMVTVKVAPRELAGPSWEFDVVLETHAQTLDDDLMKTAALVDEQGRRHAPLAWRGDAPGGHHRKGVLVFAPIQPRPASLELEIRRAGEKAPRRFKWPMP